MTILELGAIGEFVGAIAVVLTLFYLAIQIRQNTKATRKQSVRDAMEFIYSSSGPLIGDQQLAEIYLKGMKDFNSLQAAEQIRFHYLCTTRLQAAQTADALLEDDMQQSREWVSRMMRNAGFRTWWIERGQYVVNPEFRLFCEDLRREIESTEQNLSYSETYQRDLAVETTNS